MAEAPRRSPSVLLTVYGLFVVAAGARAGVQLTTAAHEAPVAYALSAAAAGVYLAGWLALRSPTPTGRRLAGLVCLTELGGVLLVGTLSLVVPAWFPRASVWSGYGVGYGFVPVALPAATLLWLGRRPKPLLQGEVMPSHRENRALLDQAHVALRSGRPGVADVAGQRLELRNVVVSEGRVIGLTTGDQALGDETRCTDPRGNLRLRSGDAIGDLDVWLVGRWHRISTVEILADAYAWLPHVPAVALMDPRQWIDQATVLALEVTCGTVRQTAGAASPGSVLHLSDAHVRLLLRD